MNIDAVYTEHHKDTCPECGHVGGDVFVKGRYVQVRCEACGALVVEIEAEDPPGYEEMVRH